MSDPIDSVEVYDVRFPTASLRQGSDALNAGDYSATYVVVRTGDGLEGHGLTFTNGRGNELCVAAVRALQHHVLGLSIDEIFADMALFWRSLTADVQLRWLGPEKGVLHMATGALVNAVWDLRARALGLPMWKLLADMPTAELLSCIDFSYITDALTPDEAGEILDAGQAGITNRTAALLHGGLRAYTTSAGWLGYPDEQVRALCRQAIAAGWRDFKMKVGLDIEQDVRRAELMRSEVGPDGLLMLDANQAWGVDEAIENLERLRPVDPYWIEEPTHPDDILGHARIAASVAPIRVATGEVAANRVIFKQLLQANAISVCQVDACRIGGVNEVLAVLLLARKFGVDVVPHAGGVGLCEYVQHIAAFDALRVRTAGPEHMVEYIDHLHEHFVTPVEMRGPRYMLPSTPGYSVELKPASVADYSFPDGPVWKT